MPITEPSVGQYWWPSVNSVNKAGDLSDPDNYRGITISAIISKVFEICLLDKCAHFIQSHDIQLGVKKSKSCSMAIFCVQHVVNNTLLTMVAMYTLHH